MRLLRKNAAAALVVALLAGCGQAPIKPASTHISATDATRAQGRIPPPVEIAPALPAPTPTVRAETYSVVVNNVEVHDLLFALARNAKVNVDIEPGISGRVTLNAIDQTLQQLLTRIARQVDMRYELRGQDLVIRRDTPYLHTYHIDYVNLSREVKSVSSLSTQISGSSSTTAARNNSTSTITSDSTNKFWETLVANVKDILRETDKILPAAAVVPAVPQPPSAQGASAAKSPAAAMTQVAYREAASVIANPETGILTIRATARQHAKIQQFLDQVMASAKREALIEATVAEVQLNNQYQRGIDWSKLRTGSSGFQITQSSANTPAGINTSAFVVGYALGNYDFTSAVKLLESFGTVRVLSSPKISVLNNQSAVLKVVDNLVYFTVQANTNQTQGVSTTTFTTTSNSVPVGFIMTVVPQISASNSILMSLRPSISRKIGDVADPNPDLAKAGVTNLLPVIQSREMESVLRVQSGQVAVLGGLMQDSVNTTEDTVPGLNRIPGIGSLFEQRKDVNEKTELVIFLRATVVKDPSLSGDFSNFRSLLPGKDYFSKPVNPSKPESLN